MFRKQITDLREILWKGLDVLQVVQLFGSDLMIKLQCRNLQRSCRECIGTIWVVPSASWRLLPLPCRMWPRSQRTAPARSAVVVDVVCKLLVVVTFWDESRQSCPWKMARHRGETLGDAVEDIQYSKIMIDALHTSCCMSQEQDPRRLGYTPKVKTPNPWLALLLKAESSQWLTFWRIKKLGLLHCCHLRLQTGEGNQRQLKSWHPRWSCGVFAGAV